MANLKVLVRPDIKDWIDARVENGDFASADDYLSELVERDREESRSDDERIEAIRRMIEESERSGISNRTLDDLVAGAVDRARSVGTYRE